MTLAPCPAGFSTGSKKRRDANGGDDATSLFAHSSTREAAGVQYGGSATATLETETAQDRDARAIMERNLALNDAGVLDDGKYHGEAGRRNLMKN